MEGVSRSRPAVVIPPLPPGCSAPQNPSPSARTHLDRDYDLSDITPPARPIDSSSSTPMQNPWDNNSTPTSSYPYSQNGNGYHYNNNNNNNNNMTLNVLPSSRPPSRSSTASAAITPTPTIAFPEPQIYRSVSALPRSPQPSQSSLSSPHLAHRHSRSDVGPDPLRLHRDPSSLSVMSSHSSPYYDADELSISDDSHGHSEDDSTIVQQLSDLTLQSEEGMERFQRGMLNEKDEEWHRLVPKEALSALPKNEVNRQSVIFELIKSEREYVSDLETIMDVFIRPLETTRPPIIPPQFLPNFIEQVFGNVRHILSHHQRILAALFARQRETHPLVQSIADIILDIIVKEDFRAQYEQYVKHYPLAESHHRNEMRKNRDYQHFIQHTTSTDKRVRKRDLATFLSRPVTRLPRLNLLLETILKETNKEYEHPDLETLPLITGILATVVKSTQPGIEAAESKVKFWELAQSLVFRKGEIIDMDLYNQRRTLEFTGPVVRKAKNEYSSSAAVLALLDHYVLILREEKRPNGVKRQLISRPIPLAYLRLGPFDAPSELKRDPEESANSTLPLLLSKRNVEMFPFTIYHAYNSLDRRYTLYVTSEAMRKKWKEKFSNALGLFTANQEANMFFAPNTLTDNFFRFPSQLSSQPTSTTDKTGRITSAVSFTSHDRRFIAVGCSAGIFVAPRGTDRFRRVLQYSNPTTLIAMQGLGSKIFNKFIILFDSTLVSYSLDLLARVALKEAEPKTLNASMERIAGGDTNVLFVKQAIIGQRMLIIYASRKFLSSSLHLHTLEVVDVSDLTMKPNRIGGHFHGTPKAFRTLGEPGYVPKDASDVSALAKTIGVSTQDGILILNPADLARSQTALVPDLRDVSTNMPMATLKHRIETEKAKPLGLVRCNDQELLVVYDRLGVYITRHGVPTRSSGFVKWEITATSFAFRGPRLLLMCSGFIEIRDIASSALLQVIEGRDIRLMWSSPSTPIANMSEAPGNEEPILVAMRGEKDDPVHGASDKIVELEETREISATGPRTHQSRPSGSSVASANGTSRPAMRSPSSAPAMWAEWDM